MSGFTDIVEQDLLDYVIATYGGTTKYIGLSSTNPGEDGLGVTEPSSGGYSRVSTTDAGDWNVASGSAPATKSNSVTKSFPTATADWSAGANMTHFAIFDAASLGNVVTFGALGTPKPVLNGDTASFQAGSLVLKLGDPTDTY